MSLTHRVVAGGAGLLMALGMAGGIASAEPNVENVVHSTCTYPQVIAALNDQDPNMAAQIQASPIAVNYLQGLVNSPPGSEDRRQRIAMIQGYPEFATYATLINTVAGNCSNY